MFRWFVGLGIDDPVWDHSTFSKNCDRLLAGDVGLGTPRSAIRTIFRPTDQPFAAGFVAASARSH